MINVLPRFASSRIYSPHFAYCSQYVSFLNSFFLRFAFAMLAKDKAAVRVFAQYVQDKSNAVK
jgi:hypothetical protein